MKNIYLLIVATAASFSGFSQFSLGLQAANNLAHTDANPGKSALAFGGNVQFKPLDYLAVKGNLNIGQLKGGDASEKSLMSFSNNYIQADLNLKFFPFGLANTTANKTIQYLSYLYGGVGIGMIDNNAKVNQLQAESFRYMGDYKGAEMVYPVELGFELPLGTSSTKFSLNAFYRINLTNSDKIDGYEPNLIANKAKDSYTSFGIGVSYNFGLGKKSGNALSEEKPKFVD
jgi:hypothetical protein